MKVNYKIPATPSASNETPSSTYNRQQRRNLKKNQKKITQAYKEQLTQEQIEQYIKENPDAVQYELDEDKIEELGLTNESKLVLGNFAEDTIGGADSIIDSEEVSEGLDFDGDRPDKSKEIPPTGTFEVRA